MLELLCQHLEKIAANAGRNMMTVSNLGVCFGPTLLRDEEETVAAIMDIKFGNVVVEILIENWRHVSCYVLSKKALVSVQWDGVNPKTPPNYSASHWSEKSFF